MAALGARLHCEGVDRAIIIVWVYIVRDFAGFNTYLTMELLAASSYQ